MSPAHADISSCAGLSAELCVADANTFHFGPPARVPLYSAWNCPCLGSSNSGLMQVRPMIMQATWWKRPMLQTGRGCLLDPPDAADWR